MWSNDFHFYSRPALYSRMNYIAWEPTCYSSVGRYSHRNVDIAEMKIFSSVSESLFDQKSSTQRTNDQSLKTSKRETCVFRAHTRLFDDAHSCIDVLLLHPSTALDCERKENDYFHNDHRWEWFVLTKTLSPICRNQSNSRQMHPRAEEITVKTNWSLNNGLRRWKDKKTSSVSVCSLLTFVGETWSSSSTRSFPKWSRSIASRCLGLRSEKTEVAQTKHDQTTREGQKQ